MRYSKQELLNLQQSCLPEAWDRILSSIDPSLYQEICGLVPADDNNCSRRHPRRRNVDRRDRSLHAPPSYKAAQEELPELLLSHPLVSDETVEDSQGLIEQEDIYEDSDDEGSLQPLAFYVDGEPDFESGPPLDGYEYLRRVMWEAAQCPKVKTAKIQRKDSGSKQTAYMPEIPPIPTCPPELIPSKDWRNSFLADFSDLRASFTRLLAQHTNMINDLLPLPPIQNKDLWKSFCFSRANKSDKNNHHPMDEKGSEIPSTDVHEASERSSSDEETFHRERACGIIACSPFLNILLRLDEISRAILFRYHVLWLKEQTHLSYERALWLFSLSVAVDFPLDDQTSAAFRDLLRKCAEFRKDKQPQDEELHMLNILITIAGDFFGQAEHPVG